MADKFRGGYDACPLCGEFKYKHSTYCRKCRTKRNRPPIIEETFTLDGEECRYLPLTRGLYAIVNACKYAWCMQWAWHAFLGTQGVYYAARKVLINGKSQYVFLHSVLTEGWEGGKYTDHRNGSTLDDRLSNLRRCNKRQNHWNCKVPVSNQLGRKGVTKGYVSVTGAQAYEVHIKDHGKSIYLGRDYDLDGATRLYDRAAIKYFGEFARTNFHREEYE